MNPKLSIPLTTEQSSFSSFGCYHCYTFMGAHPAEENGVHGWKFRVWAPAAVSVSVIGDFNQWQPNSHPMAAEPGGLWSCFIPGLAQYDTYQYAVRTADGRLLKKADPYAFHAETRPGTSSKLYDLEGYQWHDARWQDYRTRSAGKVSPINLYEVHLGSWRRTGDGQMLNYRSIAHYLVPYVKEMGYTGVKFLPVGEHPLDESLGYQLTGYFAVTSRFGTPTDFMYLVDQLHQAGISVILDSVSTGFPRDDFGLYLFDGVPCYGVPDPLPEKEAEAPSSSDEDTVTQKPPVREVCEFDISKPEVHNFLVSSVFFWLDKFHVDGVHFTGTPCESADFISQLNQKVHKAFPYVTTFAGEPQALTGFDHSWNTAWVEQMLARLTEPDTGHTASIFSAAKRPMTSCVLPLSHDLVSAPRPSLASRMLGDDNMKFAQVRAFYLFFLTQPGSKLTMMGTEFGQWNSWNCLQSLDWHLLQYDFYQKQQRFFRDANNLYLSTPALWERDSDESFRIIKDGAGDQIAAYVRQGTDGSEYYIAANFSSSGQDRCRLEVLCAGEYQVLFSSDDFSYGGQNLGSRGILSAQTGRDGSWLLLSLPHMSAVVLKCVHRQPWAPTPRP